MIKVTVELFPFGLENNKRHLGTIFIWNDASGTKTNGNYKFKILKAGEQDSIWKTGEVKDFPRKRLLIWDLLFRCLKEIVATRN